MATQKSGRRETTDEELRASRREQKRRQRERRRAEPGGVERERAQYRADYAANRETILAGQKRRRTPHPRRTQTPEERRAQGRRDYARRRDRLAAEGLTTKGTPRKYELGQTPARRREKKRARNRLDRAGVPPSYLFRAKQSLGDIPYDSKALRTFGREFAEVINHLLSGISWERRPRRGG